MTGDYTSDDVDLSCMLTLFKELHQSQTTHGSKQSMSLLTYKV